MRAPIFLLVVVAAALTASLTLLGATARADNWRTYYPAKLKQTYDPIVVRMAKSFRPGTGFQMPRGKP
jgi:hypothetical protein